MATVRKCDICGSIYELYPNEKTVSLGVQDAKEPERSFAMIETTDCCPECTKKILDLVDVMKLYGDEYVVWVKTKGEILNEVE